MHALTINTRPYFSPAVILAKNRPGDEASGWVGVIRVRVCRLVRMRVCGWVRIMRMRVCGWVGVRVRVCGLHHWRINISREHVSL